MVARPLSEVVARFEAHREVLTLTPSSGRGRDGTALDWRWRGHAEETGSPYPPQRPGNPLAQRPHNTAHYQNVENVQQYGECEVGPMGLAGDPTRRATGEAYERYLGRRSARIASKFVRWLNQPSGAAWLDVG